MSEKLRSCPFCNYDEAWTQYDQDYFVECKVCNSRGPKGNSREKAEDLWNGVLSKIDMNDVDGYLNESVLNEEIDMLGALLMYTVYRSIKGIPITKLPQYLAENANEIFIDFIDFTNSMGYTSGIDTNVMKKQFDDTLKKILGSSYKSYKLREEAMGGVSAPMATLNNTPGVGNAVPASAAATTGAQFTSDTTTGSGDRWDNTTSKKKKGKKGKKSKSKKYKITTFDDFVYTQK